jgi:hypothetical protein
MHVILMKLSENMTRILRLIARDPFMQAVKAHNVQRKTASFAVPIVLDILARPQKLIAFSDRIIFLDFGDV